MIGRPKETEAAPYYFTYIREIEGDDPVSTMAGQLEETSSFFATISEEKSRHRYAPQKWSIRQVLNHLSDSERMFAGRALWFARGFDSALPSFDQNIAANAANADNTSWARHVEEFHNVRLASVSLFTNMPADAWLKSGIASDNRFTVRALAYIIAGHLAYHLKILRERYL